MYNYKGRQLNIDESLQDLFDTSYAGGPLSDEHVERACQKKQDELSDDDVVNLVNRYMKAYLDLSGVLPDEEYCGPTRVGYIGDLSVYNFVKTESSPEDEHSIKERLFESHSNPNQIPVSEYPDVLRPFVSKWRSVFGKVRAESSEHNYALLSVMFEGSYYSFSHLSLGGSVSDFVKHMKEMENELLSIGCAFREEVW